MLRPYLRHARGHHPLRQLLRRRRPQLEPHHPGHHPQHRPRQRPIIRSDGTFIRDYFYVEDGANAYITLAEALAASPNLAGRAFNFSNEIQVTVLEITRKVLALMNSGLEPDVRNEASNEIKHQYLSARRAREDLNWKPLFTLDQGLARTIDWYRRYFASAAL